MRSPPSFHFYAPRHDLARHLHLSKGVAGNPVSATYLMQSGVSDFSGRAVVVPLTRTPYDRCLSGRRPHFFFGLPGDRTRGGSP